jgi:hypothetical protein
LQHNPIRYDSEGEELYEEDEDSEADAAAAEENPFSGIALESRSYFFCQITCEGLTFYFSLAALLCPLKHPSELPVHPSLSHPYTSQALEQMTQAVEEKLRQEKALLWRARNLHRKFLGDGSWMPCGLVEIPDDRYIFEPRIVEDTRTVSAGQQRQSALGTPSASSDMNGPQDVLSTTALGKEGQATHSAAEERRVGEGDVEMTEVPAASGGIMAVSNDSHEPVTEFKSEETDAMVKDLPQHPAEESDKTSENNTASARNGLAERQEEMATSKEAAKTNGEHTHHNEANEDENEQDTEMHDGSSPEPPRRMTTRAQANANNPSDDNQSPSLSADNSSFLQTPHPLFVIPETVRPDANFGLPPGEAEETRRLLWSYIQKQEETVRGFEHMLESLLRASHMKADVLEWCKAEGHVGEMSDGEDWYDREKWGLAEGEDLKKGTDEDEVETVDESRTAAKRGRGRRQ